MSKPDSKPVPLSVGDLIGLIECPQVVTVIGSVAGLYISRDQLGQYLIHDLDGIGQQVAHGWRAKDMDWSSVQFCRSES